jgi:hypothetical protein
MAVYFNELTLDKVPQQNCMLLREFRDVFACFSAATDGKVKRLIANDAGMAGLWDAAASCGNREAQTFICTFVNPKFKARPEDDYSDNSLDHFNGSEYRLKTQDGEMTECQMMGWACLNRSLTLGLRSSRFWEQFEYDIEEESLENGESVVSAMCITKESQVSLPRVQGWIAANREFEDVPEPTPCLMPPEQKHIKFQEHHGKEILRDFCRQIVKHRFVQGVVDSIAFDSTTNRFILKCYQDGIVDLRLHWTDMGVGLKVQTVGKDLRQTMLIAEILKDRYDRCS